jgi:carbon-monoxide dehydrogenase small subunit
MLETDDSTKRLSLSLNGAERSMLVSPSTTLLEVLREDFGLTGTNHGCESGECGTCTVLLDDEPVLSCLLLAMEADGRSVTTVEGMGDETGEPHPLQKTFVEEGAAQCGYCTSGMLLAGKHLLETNPDPDRSEIETAIEGNICRCTGYQKIITAIDEAANYE